MPTVMIRRLCVLVLCLLSLAPGDARPAQDAEVEPASVQGPGVVIRPNRIAITIPPLPDAPRTAAPAPVAARGKLPPPAGEACFTRSEVDQALRGTGCDCSCDGYARGPDRRCRAACGIAYYACWAPDPTAADVDAALAAAYADAPPEVAQALMAELARQPAMREDMRGGVMLQRAAAWDEARMCPEPR